jgi:hypothetical protein
MSFYEELLTLGQHLHERERFALYKFYIKAKKDVYRTNAVLLSSTKVFNSRIANGEILYQLNGNTVSYSARRNGTSQFQENVRTLKLSTIPRIRVNNLVKFFAQTEVEVIWNFPLQGHSLQEEGSYCILFYPYFDLRYFSNGKNRIFGLINKIKTNDKELLTKLRTL